MELEIRQAEAADAPRIALLEQQCFADPWSEETIRHEIVDNPMAAFLVGASHGQVQGYIGYWIIQKDLCINNVAVAPETRRKQVGTRLMTTLLEQAEAAGLQGATLEVRVSNQPAIALYTGLGFQSAGIRPHYYQDNGEDAIIMWRTVG